MSTYRSIQTALNRAAEMQIQRHNSQESFAKAVYGQEKPAAAAAAAAASQAITAPTEQPQQQPQVKRSFILGYGS